MEAQRSAIEAGASGYCDREATDDTLLSVAFVWRRPSLVASIARGVLVAVVFDNATIFQRVVDLGDDIPPSLAKLILSRHLSPIDQKRHERLASKAQAGSLTPDEEVELDNLIRIDTLLAILRIRARRSPARDRVQRQGA